MPGEEQNIRWTVKSEEEFQPVNETQQPHLDSTNRPYQLSFSLIKIGLAASYIAIIC